MARKRLTGEEIGKGLQLERQRHEKELDRLLTAASEQNIYVPGANPFKYPGTFRGPFRAATS